MTSRSSDLENCRHFTTTQSSLRAGSVREELPWILRVGFGLRHGHHVFDLQSFDGNDAKAIHKPSCGLMHKVMATMLDTLMNAGDDTLGFATSLCLVLVLDLIELALCFRQSLFVLAEEARVFNELAVGESRKDFEANVNADFLGRGFKRLWLNLAGEAGIPLARSRSADSAGLNVAFNPTVKMNGNVANLWIRNLG